MLPLLAIIGYFASAFGWGCALVIWALPRGGFYPALTAALGLVALSFVGGMLNALHGVNDVTLDALVVIGWVLAAIFLVCNRTRLRNVVARENLGDLPAAVVLGAVFVFLTLTLLPGYSFNIFDDFQIYLALPVRMLQLGTLAGNPFDGAGSAVLGAQSFFQAIILRRFGLGYVAGFDAVFCLVLAGWLVIEIARLAGVNRGMQLLALAVYLGVNPATANITSVYSGGLMVLTLAALTILLARSPANGRIAFLLGACAAAAVTFKVTYLLVVAIYGICIVGLDWLHARRQSAPKIVTGRAITIALAGAAAVLVPWIAVYGPDSISLLPLLAQNPIAIPPFERPPGYAPLDLDVLLTFKPFIYGATYGAYGIGVAALLLAAGLVLWRLAAITGSARRRDIPIAEIAAGALAVACLVSFFASSFMTDLESVLRFAAPVFASALALTTILLGLRIQEIVAEGPSRPSDLTVGRFLRQRSLLLVPALVVALFAPSLRDRIVWAAEYRTQISFAAARDTTYLTFLQNTLGVGVQTWLSGLQGRIPENERIFVWSSNSFLMDYRRNPIFAFTMQGYSHPFLRFPPAGSAKETTQALKNIGVRYILWEHAGYTMGDEREYIQSGLSRFNHLRKTNLLTLRLLSYLKFIGQRTTPVYADNRIVIFAIESILD